MTVSDSAILEAIPFLARHSGVLGEPAAAAALAGLSTGLKEGLVESRGEDRAAGNRPWAQRHPGRIPGV